MNIKRPGIDPNWSGAWDETKRSNIRSIDVHDVNNIRNLEFFVVNGSTRPEMGRSVSRVDPTQSHWESAYLASYLSMYGVMRLAQLEIVGIDNAKFDKNLAMDAFAAVYTNQMILLSQHFNFSRRFNGRILKMMNSSLLPFTALGVLICRDKRVFALARMQLRAHNKGFYADSNLYPIFQFIIRILADYLGDAPVVLSGNGLIEPIFEQLFLRWREPDAESLKEICLAACDVHTRRCRERKDGKLYEFQNGIWTRTPIEILLCFKLRLLIGLQNPYIDHPLMNTALGVIPHENDFEPSELIVKVRERMYREGCSEIEIFELR